jgi:hypothetical protein
VWARGAAEVAAPTDRVAVLSARGAAAVLSVRGAAVVSAWGAAEVAPLAAARVGVQQPVGEDPPG